MCIGLVLSNKNKCWNKTLNFSFLFFFFYFYKKNEKRKRTISGGRQPGQPDGPARSPTTPRLAQHAARLLSFTFSSSSVRDRGENGAGEFPVEEDPPRPPPTCSPSCFKSKAAPPACPSSFLSLLPPLFRRQSPFLPPASFLNFSSRQQNTGSRSSIAHLHVRRRTTPRPGMDSPHRPHLLHGRSGLEKA